MKKYISILLAFAMILSTPFSTGISATAKTSFKYVYYGNSKYGSGNGFVFKVVSSSTAAIVNCSSTSSKVTIPSTIDGYKVIGIDGVYDRPFGKKCYPYFSSTIKKLSLPSTLQYIRTLDGAIYINGNLKEITVNKSNKYFSSKDGVLYNKNKKTLLYYPPKKTTKKFTIPKSVTFIDNAISNNYITTLVIPNSVKKADYVQDLPCVANNCRKLKTIKFGKGIKKLKYGTVLNCPNLTSVVVPKGVTVESDYTFYSCPKLKSYILSKSLKLKKGSNYIKVSWKNPLKHYTSENFGYEIQYSTNKKFKSKNIVRVYSKDKTSIKIKNLKSNKKYYFRIKAFNIIDNQTYDDYGVSLDYQNVSKTKSIKSPKKCKTTKNLTKSAAEKTAINKTVKSLNLTSKKYLYCNTTTFKFCGKKYYAVEVNARSPYPGGRSSNVNRQIISVDGTEVMYGKYGYSTYQKKSCLLWFSF